MAAELEEEESSAVEEEEETGLLDSFVVEEAVEVVVEVFWEVLSVAEVGLVEEAFVLWHPTRARETRDNNSKFLFFMYKILQLRNKDSLILIKVQEDNLENRKSANISFSPNRRNRSLLFIFYFNVGQEKETRNREIHLFLFMADRRSVFDF